MAIRTDFTIKQLRVLAAVARHGSVTRTAGVLSLPQSAVSRIVNRLEAAVGTPLVIRSGHGIALTRAGERFLGHAERILHVHDLALDEIAAMKGTLSGEVRVAAPESIGGVIFAPLVKQLRSHHPDAGVRTIASHSVTIPTMLDNGTADLGIVADTHPGPPGNAEALIAEEFFLVGPRGAPETRRPEIPLEEVARLPLILNAMPGGFRTVTDRAFACRRMEPDVRIEIDANGPLIELVEAGEGFAILPFCVMCKRTQSLAAARIVDPVMSRTLSLVMARNRPVTPVWRETARLIREVTQASAGLARWTMVPPDRRTGRKESPP